MTDSPEHTENSLLRLEGMTKSFPGVLANDSVDLVLKPGEIHALLGENGAGKSTLVKMIYGILKADTGRLLWKETVTDISSPAAARELGIAMVFQHFSLFDSMSVLGPDMTRARLRHALKAVGGVSKKKLKKLEKQYRQN